MTREAANGHGLELQGLQVDSMYSRLQHVDDLELEEFENPSLPTNAGFKKRRWWMKALFWTLLLLAVTVVLVVWVFPVVLDKVLIPLMEWEASTFSRPVLALILVTSLALLPIFLFPSGPSMWLAGMIFGYGLGFLIIMAGMSVGVTVPFFIARWLFQAKIQRWIQKWPKRAALIRVADQGGWCQQFRVLLVLRVSPIPYALFNYAIATTNVKYGPYICSSCAILIPESFITIYSGRLLKTLAEMKSSKQHMTPLQITYNVLGFCLAVGVTIGVTIYGKRALEELEIKEQATRRELAAELENFSTSRMNGGPVTIVGLSQESIQVQEQASSLDLQEKMHQSK
ncbi:hypothetical protein GOP47_0013861 [Adiantum capillus-veneris]|uniref:VTT domain-containing protein n=1 Tax=Adiantum capillus-veneris TaxID=13818 RepID=A0A9D4UPB6_ADICA|nr:hypothetical protein GOP47_0013861 [Adiantum capillus-veneris]